jgi:hypothetical protein
MTDLRSVPSWINLHSTQQDELPSQLPPLGSWCLVPPTALPSVFPARLRDKIGAVLVIGAPTSTGSGISCSARTEWTDPRRRSTSSRSA